MIKKIIFILCYCFCTVTANAAIENIDIENAWARSTVGRSKISSAYMTILNNNPFPIEIVNITTDIVEVAEIHDMIHDDGIMRMRKLDSLMVPAKGKFTLYPEGVHIMLIGLTKKLLVGDKVTMTVEIKDYPAMTIMAEVKNIN